jgi:hypothetical protein
VKPEKQAGSVKEFEKVSTEDFVIAQISDIELDMNHTFKGFQGAPDKVCAGVRFKFDIEGCKYPHRSNWMKFSYGEKANLFKKFLLPLVDGAEPDMDFDLLALKGMKIKMLWAEKNGFQFPETIRPISPKIKKDTVAEPSIDMGDDCPDFGA